MKNKLDELEQILTENLNVLSEKEFLNKPSKYESMFCDILNKALCSNDFENRDETSCDCYWNGIEIELKKGNFWIDLTRYTDSPSENSITLFIKPNTRREKINVIYGIKTSKLQKALFTNEDLIEKVRAIKNSYKGFSLNMQLQLSKKFLDNLDMDINIKSSRYK